MSLRSAARLTRFIRSPVHSTARTPILARRAASNHGGGSGGSDRTWALGSAVVFIPLATWIMMPSSVGAEHTPHDTGVTAAEDQHGRRGIETIHKDGGEIEDDEVPANNPGIKEDSGTAFDNLPMEVQDGMSHQPTTKEVKESLARAEKSNVPKAAMDEESKGNQAQSEKDGNEDGGALFEGMEEDGDAPSQSEMKDSLNRSESAAVPRVAMERGEK